MGRMLRICVKDAWQGSASPTEHVAQSLLAVASMAFHDCLICVCLRASVAARFALKLSLFDVQCSSP